jgi:hypothetical protein
MLFVCCKEQYKSIMEGRNDEGWNDSQDSYTGWIEELCSICVELTWHDIGVEFQASF